jgi:argininosuccinate lyase
LVLRKVPFREAHHIVGGLVAEAERRGVELGALPRDVLVAAHPSLGDPEVQSALDPKQAVERRSVKGGPARTRVVEAIADARSRWPR